MTVILAVDEQGVLPLPPGVLGHTEPHSRCAIAHRLPDKTPRHHDEVRRCLACDQLYWKGDHFERLERFLARVLAALDG